MNTFLYPDKWTYECPWYQRACIYANRWLHRQWWKNPWSRASEWERNYRLTFDSWQRALARVRELERAEEIQREFIIAQQKLLKAEYQSKNN